MDAEMAESLAGVVRLLRRGQQPGVAAGGCRGAGFAAAGVGGGDRRCRRRSGGPAAGPPLRLRGPVPVGDDPARLLPSAHQLLSQLSTAAAAPALDDLIHQVTELVWEANTAAEA
jgi:hypothetical protein